MQKLLRPLGILTLPLLVVACGTDDEPDNPPPSQPPPVSAQRFSVRIENISGETGLPTPFAPGAYAVHDASAALIGAGVRLDGIEGMAEDGTAGPLGEALASASGVRAAGVFDTPEGEASPGPAFPGSAYTFEVEAEPGERLFLATMLVQSNDLFFAPGAEGIALFDEAGNPRDGDVTPGIATWDSGTEANQTPGAGPDQAPRQAEADVGGAEGVVRPYTDATRALPNAAAFADIAVVADGGDFTFTLTNVSADVGLAPSPLAPVFYALHDDSWSLFTAGAEDRGEGLETLAEDGSPADLVASHDGAAGVGLAAAAAETIENPGAPGPAMPGQSYRFTVSASAEHPYLTLASMIVQSNDVFLAPPASGIRLVDESGAPRAAEAVQADLRSRLALWDAGTERNEVPGVGVNQPMRQAGPNTGDADPDNTVRRYFDATNDLAEGGFARVTIAEGESAGTYTLRIENTSGDSAFPGVLTPAAFALVDGTAPAFEVGAPATAGLEALAEDGTAGALGDEWAARADVAQAGVIGEVPMMPGAGAEVSLTPTASHAYLVLATMVVPSNDTFLALGGEGVALLDGDGNPRAVADIQADLDARLRAYDGGTERNQAGALGADQPPRQAGPNTGLAEGSGELRLYDDVAPIPGADRLVRVIVRPLAR